MFTGFLAVARCDAYDTPLSLHATREEALAAIKEVVDDEDLLETRWGWSDAGPLDHFIVIRF
jgi:hypothetical protein